MPQAASNGITLEYETFGQPDDPPILLVAGWGAQLVSWDDEFCAGLVDRGFFVIRFDNRDTGLSTKIDTPDIDIMEVVAAALSGHPVAAPYLLSDMADDAWGLLDALGIARAHLVGRSMGGMIVQQMAIAHPDRVLSLTSLQSTTGDPDVGAPHPDALPILLDVAPDDRDGYIEHSVRNERATGSEDHFDEARSRRKAALWYDRCYYPRGVNNHLVALAASGSRSEGLRKLRLESLVIHGDADPVVDVSGGERTAECLQGSDLLIIDGMGHDFAPYFWPRIIEAICSVASRAATGA